MNRFLHSAPHAALRQLLITARKSKGLMQKDLASRLNKPQSYVSKYENGEKNIDVVELIEIIYALNENPKLFIENYLKEFNNIKSMSILNANAHIQ